MQDPLSTSPLALVSESLFFKMHNRSKQMKEDNIGKGKVTPAQVAFLVDRYLSDSNYLQTLTVFRAEASNLISRVKGKQPPKGLLTLGYILDEYICLKEQKVMVDHEKKRIETLLKGIQGVVDVYNSTGVETPPLPIQATGVSPSPVIRRLEPIVGLQPDGCTTISTQNAKFSRSADASSSVVTVSAKKRKNNILPISDSSQTSKKPCGTTSTNPISLSAQDPTSQIRPAQTKSSNQLVAHNPSHTWSVASVQISNEKRHLQTGSYTPNTPSQGCSTLSEISVSPPEIASNNQPNSSNSTKIAVSPIRHIGIYSVNRSPRFSPLKSDVKRACKRDHVKSRLNFDDPSNPSSCSEHNIFPETPILETNREIADIFEIDLPCFDALGADFCISDLLCDIDLDCEDVTLATAAGTECSTGFSASLQSNLDGTMGSNHSNVTWVLSEMDVNVEGTDNLQSVKSATKRITILSPVKDRRTFMDQQNCLTLE